MPVDQHLNQRIRAAVAGHVGVSEKQMMGGTCFFLHGNMLGGARRHADGTGRFMFRVGKAQEATALADPTAHPVILGTRKLGGFVYVDAEDCGDADLSDWLHLCLGHAAALPPKD